MNAQIETSAAAIRNFTADEATSALQSTCIDYARQSEHGCKLIGLLRGRLVADGTTPADAFGLTVEALMSGSMAESKAKNTANNGKGHEGLAEFVLKDVGCPLKESHFYACPVSHSRKLAKFLAVGGDDAIVVVNRMKLTDAGTFKRGALDKLLPADAVKEPTPAATTVEDDEDDALVEDGTSKSAHDRAIILLTSIQSLMLEMNEYERESIQELAAEFILG